MSGHHMRSINSVRRTHDQLFSGDVQGFLEPKEFDVKVLQVLDVFLRDLYRPLRQESCSSPSS